MTPRRQRVCEFTFFLKNSFNLAPIHTCLWSMPRFIASSFKSRLKNYFKIFRVCNCNNRTCMFQYIIDFLYNRSLPHDLWILFNTYMLYIYNKLNLRQFKKPPTYIINNISWMDEQIIIVANIHFDHVSFQRKKPKPHKQRQAHRHVIRIPLFSSRV